MLSPLSLGANVDVLLTVTAGPHAGKEYTFDCRDSFLVGRSKDAHFQLPVADPYFSRRHFLIELNPPRCRLLDLNSRNGVFVNGARVQSVELKDGDEIKGGETLFRVKVQGVPEEPDRVTTIDLPPDANAPDTVALAPSPPPEVASDPAHKFPGYDLEGELGRGGMGVVYRARRQSDGVPVALKILTPAAGASRKQRDQFLREARILGGLQHPFIVRLLDAGEADGVLFIAMELVEGSDTERMAARQGPLPISVGVRLICQAISGLAHAHSAGFVHRDIKPSNLLIGREGSKRVVKLADFGLARAFEASQLSGLTLNGEVGGTPAFMPPEQITHYREVNPSADQYATAATLYYLLTGKFIFDFPREISARLIKILTDDPVPIQDRRKQIPARLAAVIHRALSREITDRYPTLTAFRADLVPFTR